MSQYLNDVFNEEHGGKSEAATEQHEPEKAEQPSAAPAVAEAPPSTAEKTEGEKPAESATAAPKDDKLVPLTALEAERKGRQDWKEKALRLEGEMKAYREAQQRAQGSDPQAQQQDPMAMMQQQIINERFNNSEMSVRAQFASAGDVDAMVEVFSKHAESNPALQAELANQRHPWLFAYTEGKKLHAMSEMGGDPASYREKLRAEIEAELRAKIAAESAPPQDQSNPDAPAKPNIPSSLAGSRSSAPRSAPTWTGPTPLNEIFQ